MSRNTLLSLFLVLSGLAMAHYLLSKPVIKIPPINVAVISLLRPLIERVWVTKYYGTPSEVLGFYDASLCSTWPDQEKGGELNEAENKNNFLWEHKCRPVEIKMVKTGKDLSGIVIVRMLDFGKSKEILQDVFHIIETNLLGSYRMGTDKKEFIKEMIRKELESENFKLSINYKDRLSTYYGLEGYYFFKKNYSVEPYQIQRLENKNGIKFHCDRAKEQALLLQFNLDEYKKEGDIVEFTLNAPPGFFGF